MFEKLLEFIDIFFNYIEHSVTDNYFMEKIKG